MEDAAHALTSKLGRQLLIPEIAAETGLSGSRVERILSLDHQTEEIDLNTIFDESPHPTELAEKLDVEESLMRLLDALPARQADVLKKYHLEGKTLLEIATLFGTSVELIRQLRVAGEAKIKAAPSAHDLWQMVST